MPRSELSSDFDQDALRELVECNPRKSTQELALGFYTSQFTICHHFEMIGKMSKPGIWLPSTLSEKYREDRISVVTSLFLRQRNYPFLKNIITGHGKRVFYDNVQCKWIGRDESQQPIQKVELYGRKVILCVWQDNSGIIHFEFLNRCRFILSTIDTCA